eukprot:scaffold10191_cov108-Isochrysis_galbana.AAC.6
MWRTSPKLSFCAPGALACRWALRSYTSLPRLRAVRKAIRRLSSASFHILSAKEVDSRYRFSLRSSGFPHRMRLPALFSWRSGATLTDGSSTDEIQCRDELHAGVALASPGRALRAVDGVLEPLAEGIELRAVEVPLRCELPDLLDERVSSRLAHALHHLDLTAEERSRDPLCRTLQTVGVWRWWGALPNEAVDEADAPELLGEGGIRVRGEHRNHLGDEDAQIDDEDSGAELEV